jgi:hypothetical protein
MSAAKQEPSAQISQHFELLNSAQLAERLNLPESWVREFTRSRTSDPIPHHRFGRYVRFQWGSPPLVAWISRRMRGGK